MDKNGGGEIKERRWFNTEIPLWGLLTMAVSMGGWLVNLEYRVRTLEAESVVFKKTYESVGKMVWQVDTMTQGFLEIKDNVKAITTQNMDIWMLQREVSDINCRTGGRCVETPQRRAK
ncbi:hypothetical protein [Comamonas sp. C24C]